MEGWRIAVLVCMIVVWLLAVGILLWFWYTNCVRVTYLRTPSAYVFHFYDFEKRLISLDIQKVEGSPIPLSIYNRYYGISNNTANNAADSSAPPGDRSGTVPPLNLQGGGNNNTMLMGSSQQQGGGGGGNSGAVYDLYRKDHFIMALTQRIGEGYSMNGGGETAPLAVSRLDRNGAGSLLVELNLDDFLAPDKRDDHMRSTAIVPCVLTRHFRFDRNYFFNNNTSAMGGGGNYTTNASRFVQNGTMHYSNNMSQQQQQQQSIYTPRDSRMQSALPSPRDRSVMYGAEMMPVGGGGGGGGGEGMPLPVPLILPISPNITTNTPICLSSALYLFENDNANRQRSSPFGEGDGAVGSEPVPTAMAERLEQLIMMDRSNGTFTVGPNAIATVNVKHQSAVIKFTNGARARRVQRVATGLPISYHYDGPNQSLPYDANAPLYLPPGRWTLCATVTNEYGTDIRTQSRVFTVEIANIR